MAQNTNSWQATLAIAALMTLRRDWPVASARLVAYVLDGERRPSRRVPLLGGRVRYVTLHLSATEQ